jgi:hypothetical protein
VGRSNVPTLLQEKSRHEKTTEKDEQNGSSQSYAASQTATRTLTGEQRRAEV